MKSGGAAQQSNPAMMVNDHTRVVINRTNNVPRRNQIKVQEWTNYNRTTANRSSD